MKQKMKRQEKLKEETDRKVYEIGVLSNVLCRSRAVFISEARFLRKDNI